MDMKQTIYVIFANQERACHMKTLLPSDSLLQISSIPTHWQEGFPLLIFIESALIKSQPQAFSHLIELANMQLIPVIVVTNEAPFKEQAAILREGADDCLDLSSEKDYLKAWIARRLHSQKRLNNLLAHSVKNRFQKIHLHLVDDDTIVLEILKKQFSNWTPFGIHVLLDTYEDGDKFLSSDWYTAEDAHILILDRMMPKVTGFEVLQQVRAGFPSTNVLIVLLTSKSGLTDIESSLASGADDYITKPFRPKEVVLRVERLIGRQLI